MGWLRSGFERLRTLIRWTSSATRAAAPRPSWRAWWSWSSSPRCWCSRPSADFSPGTADCVVEVGDRTVELSTDEAEAAASGCGARGTAAAAADDDFGRGGQGAGQLAGRRPRGRLGPDRQVPARVHLYARRIRRRGVRPSRRLRPDGAGGRRTPRPRPAPSAGRRSAASRPGGVTFGHQPGLGALRGARGRRVRPADQPEEQDPRAGRWRSTSSPMPNASRSRR